MANYEDKLCEAIELIVEKSIASANYDRTIKATIVSCVDQSIGKFKVKYQDSSFYAYATSSEVTYTRGKEVYVLIPGNDMSAEKTILGTTAKLGADYAVEPEGDEAYEVVGTNCIHSSAIYELCSYTPQEQILYEYGKTNAINISGSALDEYIKKSSSLICGAIFRTNLPTEQQFRGNYGIGFELVFRDNTTNKDVIRKYLVDVNQMSGNPYKIVHDTRQYGIFDIDGENFKYVNKIYLFVNDFPNTANNKPKDIFIKNLELSGAKLLDPNELASCALTFITPQGTFFDSNDINKSTRRIEAQVRVKGKVIDKSSQALDYYWFVENIGVTSLSEYYNKYGGQGWKCLNKHNVIKPQEGTNAAVVEWVPDDYVLEVSKDESLAKETRYKCVVIYSNTTTVTKEITITNYSSEYNITIDSDSGTQFYYDIGHPTLTCKINGAEKGGSDFKYAWAQIDNNNNYFGLAETIEDNNKYNNAAAAYKNLESQIKAETKLAAASQDELNRYKSIIDSYETITRVETNKIYKINVNEITNFMTYKCAVYYKGVYIGTGSIILNNTLNVEGAYSLVINNGAQVFKYNESGVSPTVDNVENPQALRPLSFTIFDNLGQPIDKEITDKCKIKWIVPTENTMISIPNTSGITPVPDLVNHTNIYNNIPEISYIINRNYDIKKTNNNIKLIVEYKDMSLVNITDFTFAKEGEPGTNGTEFLCKIVPNTSNPPLYPAILNGQLNYTPAQSGKWFKVQLWHNGEKVFDNISTGSSSEGKQVTVVWEILRNKYSSTISDNTDINVNSSTGAFTYSGYSKNMMPANIVKCSIKYDNCDYYATMPIITATANSGFSIKLKDYSGFRYATYSADGRTPIYDTTNPFELIVTQNIDGKVEDISTLTKTYAVTYNWQIRGKIYNPVTKEWDSSIHIGKRNVTNLQRNQAAFKPLDDYDGECVNNALECIVSRDSIEVARIHIPIHLLINKYGHAAINGWDGNSVNVDKDGSGVILAPQVGAGQKESDNSFTGMLMGKVKEAGKRNADMGLFGYASGQRTIFLNSQNGSAILGKNNSGQIIIDPSSNVAMLYSHNYWKEDGYVTDGKNAGLPKSYSSSNENKQGMLIDLTTPQIKWGNENFSVNEDGHIKAKGGGEIAGWNIDDTRIYSSANVSGSNPKITMDSSLAAIYSNNKTAMNNTRDGFYIGSDGFALGAYSTTKGHNPFQVNNEGYLFSNSGSIGGFNIADNTLSAGNNSSAVGMSSKSGVQWAFWAGAEDAGSAPFHVGHNGSLYSTSGQIGGWNIGSTQLTGGNMSINSNGSMSGSNWSINTNGYARFTDVYISNGNTSLSSTAKMIDIGNFYVTAGGAMHATSGSIAGNLVSSGINASNITSGTLDIRNGNAYLKMGFGTSHPEASGFNITGGYGIKLNGNGISECSGLAVTTVTTYNTSAVDFNAGLNITGPLYAGEVSDFYRGVNSTTLYVKRTDAAGNDNGYYTIQINRGIIHNVIAHNP